MQDVKMTDQLAGHAIAGRKNAGHENAGQENARHFSFMSAFILYVRTNIK